MTHTIRLSQARDGQWYYTLRAGTAVLATSETYTRRADARRAARRLRRAMRTRVWRIREEGT